MTKLDLDNPFVEPLIEDMSDKNKRLIVNEGDFPIQAFHFQLQNMALELEREAGFLVPYTLGSVLFAASVCLGNAVKIETAPNRIEPAILFLSLVGPKGSGKTDPLSFIVDFLERLATKLAKEFKLDMDSFNNSDPKGKKPVEKKILVKNSTTEALALRLLENPRGIGLCEDELQSWFGNFDRYSRGSSDQPFWLALYNGVVIDVDRKTTESFRVETPFCSVIGGIQPTKLSLLGSRMRDSDGFLDRLLYVYPEKIEPKPMMLGGISQCLISRWESILKNILSLDFEPRKPRILKIKPEARALIMEWNRGDIEMRREDHQYWGVMSKLDRYLFRLALVLRVLKYANGDHLDYVDEDDVASAIALVKYFSTTALRIYGHIYGSLLSGQPFNKQELFLALPKDFTTASALNMAKELGFPERTAKRFFSDNRFFRRISQGHYEKRSI